METKNKREEIINCAAHLFDTKGYHSTSVEDICNCVGITKGTIYYYIKSKEELLYDIHDRFITAAIERAKNVTENTEIKNAKDKLVAVIKAHVSIMYDFQKEIRVFFREMDSLGPENFKIIDKKRDVFRNEILNIIEEGVRNGEFRSVIPIVACFTVIGAVNWMYQWYHPDSKLSSDEIAQEIVGIVLNGLATNKNNS